MYLGDFPGGPLVTNLLSNIGDVSSIPDWETKIPHSVGQLSLYATTREPTCHKEPMQPNKYLGKKKRNVCEERSWERPKEIMRLAGTFEEKDIFNGRN